MFLSFWKFTDIGGMLGVFGWVFVDLEKIFIFWLLISTNVCHTS